MRATTTVLKAAPASTNRRGGSPPAHRWVDRATEGFTCEGLNPGDPLDHRRFAPQHDGHINRGERFLWKTWVLGDKKTEFRSRHCDACGDFLDRQATLEGGEN